MKKLAVLPDTPAAQEVLRRLEAASIDATMTTEWPGPFMGDAPMAVIWIANDADDRAAVEILESVRYQEVHFRCPECGYDLRGHAGGTHCPECGVAVSATPRPRTCHACGEEVPGNFDVCWSCGREMETGGEA